MQDAANHDKNSCMYQIIIAIASRHACLFYNKGCLFPVHIANWLSSSHKLASYRIVGKFD